MVRCALLSVLVAESLAGKCCWSNWGDSSKCGGYPSGASGGICSADWASPCTGSTACDAVPVPPPTPPTPTPAPPTPTPSPAPTPGPSDDVRVYQDATFNFGKTIDVTYAQGLSCTSDQYSASGCNTVDLKLDIYMPQAKSNGIPVPALKPAYIMMHGGGNTGGTKGGLNIQVGKWWAQRGFVAFDINYRLAGDKGLLPPKGSNSSLQWQPYWGSAYPAIRDAKAAIRFVRSKASEYGIDPGRIAATGGSAGATDMLAAGVTFESDFKDEITTDQDRTLASTNLQESSSLQALVLHWAHDDGVSLAQAHNGGSDRYSPSNPPVVSFHGNQDTTIPIEHAYNVQAAYAKTGVTYDLHVLDGCPHGSWCYDGKGACTCSGNPRTMLMEELALPVVVDGLDLTLVASMEASV